MAKGKSKGGMKLMNWASKSLFYGPLQVIQAHAERWFFQARSLCPFRQCKSEAVVSDPRIIAAVPLLFCPSSPFAIIGFIVAVGIDAFKSQSRWAWPHVAEERLERTFPFFTHLDATTTIIRVSNIFLIVATAFSAFPSQIFAASSCTVGFEALAIKIVTKATATLGIAVREGCATYNGHNPAITTALPHSFPLGIVPAMTYYYEAAKAFSCEVFEIISWHLNYLRCSLFREWCAATGTEYRVSGATLAA